MLSLLKKPESIDIILTELIDKTFGEVSRKEISILLLAVYRGVQKLPLSLFPEELALQSILEYMRGIMGNIYIKAQFEPVNNTGENN